MAKKKEAAGMMALFSAFVLVEGCARTVSAIAAGRGVQWTSEEDVEPPFFAPAVLLVAAVTEVLFGLAGLGTALASLAYEFDNAMVTSLTLGLEFCGWFTFVVFTMVQPGWTANNSSLSLHGSEFTEGESDGLVTLGILGSICYCAALQGGQVLFTMSLLTIQKGDEDARDASFYKTRHLYYSFLYFFSGVIGTAYGAMVYSNADDGQLAQPVISPPWFCTYPEMTLTVGVFSIVVGLWSLARAGAGMSGNSSALGFPLALSFLLHLMLNNLSQLSIIASNAGGPNVLAASPMLLVLTLSLHIMPAYLDAKIAGEE